ncbi:MAG TPA: hypothetical protein VFD89_02720 [Clostridia bacterium]|nr:hypothetical protein [Clostridia bacterium]
MICCLDKDILQEKLDGSLGHVEDMLLSEHLRCCKSCSREYSQMSSVFDGIDAIKGPIDIPGGLFLIRNQVLNRIPELESSSTYSLGEFIRIQKTAVKSSGKFLEYVPGTKYVEAGIKKAPKIFYRAFSFAMIRGIKFATGRSRT